MADVKWIKITTDIFDDDKILLIEAMPEADALIVIWFKLLCLAGKQNNSGVFTLNDKIAYTDEMIATIFRRPVNTVRLALRVFEEYGMIELINGIITIPNWDKHQSLDALEKKREYQKELMRKRRQEQKLICEANSDTNSDANVSPLDKNKKRIDKNREDKNNKTAVYYPDDEALNEAFKDFVLMRKQIKAPLTDKAVELAKSKLERLSNGDNQLAVEILNQSILNGWKSLYELKNSQPKQKPQEQDILDKWLNA